MSNTNLALEFKKLTTKSFLYRRFKIFTSPTNLKKTRKEILRYYNGKNKDLLSIEENNVITYLKSNPVSVFPYAFQERYKSSNVMVYEDEALKLLYIIENGKRIYFKRSWSKDKIRINWNMLMMEQDIESPHRYLTDDFSIDKDDVIVDVGCAEGNFALSVIEKVKKVYLFEGDEEWLECLKATFSPWSQKVVIVNKYVSDKNIGNEVSLDTFLSKEKINFLKMDVEGSEMQVFGGAEKILKQYSKLKLAVTTYHNQEDASKFSKYLEELNFNNSLSKGYMIFLFGKKLEPPFLRKGLIRAFKKVR